METTVRKRRERDAREALLLDAGRKLLLKGGYHGLTMARVAEATSYSKGTVYHHFSCKEELIIALAARSYEKQRDLVDRAALFKGRPRERMVAVGEATAIFARLYPDDARIFQVVNGEAITQKASEEALRRLRDGAHHNLNVMHGILRDAVVQGDLTLRDNVPPEELVFHFWLLGEAGKAASSSWMPPQEMGIDDAFGSIMHTGTVLGDGYGWRPLSTEWDYAATLARVREEVFPRECRRI
ncbi:MAG: TetR/AcrR family transcriptional regulator [bacterium]|nr:TetR/AcrR family transcriptional regulator [bacterium]